MTITNLPSYGVLEANSKPDVVGFAVEEVKSLGFTVLLPCLSPQRIRALAAEFESLHTVYQELFGKRCLEDRDEHNTIRLPLTFNPIFLYLASDEHILAIVSRLIQGKFVLNQQNGIINPSRSHYNQQGWHRDLPYQHFVSSRPIIINALYCVDDFTVENGATYVLPASHKQEAFPSEDYVEKNAVQVTAPAGSFIILDGMLYHRGGRNETLLARRAVNHVYTIPFIKQQISIPSAMELSGLDEAIKELLGYRYQSPSTVHEFITGRPSARDMSHE